MGLPGPTLAPWYSSYYCLAVGVVGMAALKVTLTLPEELLTVVDRHVACTPGATRSGVCSEALRRWLQDQQDTEIAHYYQSLSDEERAEDAAWASLAGQGAERSWR